MSRTTVTIPEELDYFLEGAVESGFFSSKSEVIQEAVDVALENEHERVAAALALHNEGKIDPEEALKLADVEDSELRSILVERLGVNPESTETHEEDILTNIYQDFSIDLPEE